MTTKTTTGTKTSNIDTKLIRDLAEILNDTNLSDIEIEKEEIRIRVSRNLEISSYPSVMPTFHPEQISAVAKTKAPQSSTTEVNVSSGDDLKNSVLSPMVGTAYLAPAPGADPFVKVGQQVQEGQTLLIVEAMKTMNFIPSPHSGTVKKILVDDAQPIEYGEPLVIVE